MDVELTLAVSSHDTVTLRRSNTSCNSDMLNGLLKYKPWRDKFIERFAWTLKEIYNKDRVNAAIDAVANEVKDEIGPMSQRFGDLSTIDDKWESNMQSLHAFANQRPAKIVALLKSAFTLSSAQSKMLDDAIK